MIIIQNEMDVRTRTAMSTFPLVQRIDQWAAIDYRLTRTPTFTDSYVDAFFKGEFKSLANPAKESGLAVPAFSMSNEVGKMMYFWVSEYTLNTAGQVYQV